MKLTPKLAEIYGTIQEKQAEGLESEDMAELRVELEGIGAVLAETQSPSGMRDLGIVPRRGIVTGPDLCPCCGRPLEE